jgi:pseudaminic acid biosynthesis-associated methylase
MTLVGRSEGKIIKSGKPVRFKTAQEEFWAGEFGDAYIERNVSEEFVASNIAFFARTLQHTRGIRDCIEFGSSVGLNLRALKVLLPKLQVHAIEINATAVDVLEKVVPRKNIFFSSILDFKPKRAYDLVLAGGILIHINPDYLGTVYEKLYRSCSRYLLISEYYNPTPVSVVYRGHKDRLFKRDFAGEMLDRYSDLSLVDYGFIYHRDANFPRDDDTWFLLEKTSRRVK